MAQNSSSRYHPLQVTLHWLIVLLVFAAFLLGRFMTQVPNDDAAKLMPLALHMSIGILTLFVMVVRLITRIKLPKPASASTGNTLLDGLGKLVHYALYLLVILMAVSGISLSMQAGLASIVFGGSAALLPSDFYDFTARLLHGFIAPALLFLVLVHIGAVVYHQFFLKDNLMSRMGYGR